MNSILTAQPLVSFVIATRNRRDVLIRTIGEAYACGLRPDEIEVIVVDNASTDGSADAVERRYHHARVLRMAGNLGPVAKNAGIDISRGRYVVFLDDDSFPRPGAIRRMIGHFEADARLGAAVFTVTLPDGSQECSAYPNICIGCGTGFRRRALAQVGGLPEDFFMQAEEYDLSLRLLAAGWNVERFDDIHVTHLKTPLARVPARITGLDVRNNMVILARYFPGRWVMPFMRDWLQRYWAIASAKGHRRAFFGGLVGGLWRAVRAKRRPLSPAAFEQFARMNQIHRQMLALRRRGVRRVLLVDFGKNILPYWLAARRCALKVVAIADPRLARPGRRYRNIPIITDADALRLAFDAVVISNLSPVHAAVRQSVWQALTGRPVVNVLDVPPVPAAGRETRQALALVA